MKKSLFFWLYFVMSIILAVYFATRFITSQMGRGPISHINHVDIISDKKDTDMTPLKMAVGIPKGASIRAIDLYQVNNRIISVPGVKDASTRRLPNGNLIIKTKQHNIVAMWSDGVMFYPLSVDGTRIDNPVEERDPNTIVFKGEIPDNLHDIINSLSVLSENIDYVNMIESRRWDIHTKNGITIYLPEENVSTAINKINLLNQNQKLLSRNIEIIDMRDNARILVKTRK